MPSGFRSAHPSTSGDTFEIAWSIFFVQWWTFPTVWRGVTSAIYGVSERRTIIYNCFPCRWIQATLESQVRLVIRLLSAWSLPSMGGCKGKYSMSYTTNMCFPFIAVGKLLSRTVYALLARPKQMFVLAGFRGGSRVSYRVYWRVVSLDGSQIGVFKVVPQVADFWSNL